MRTTLIALTAMLAALIAGCQADKKAAMTDESAIFHYDDWVYKNKTLNDGKRGFFARSFTKEEGKANGAYIFLDTVPPRCGIYSFLIHVQMDQPFEKSLDKSELVQGEMRVDDLAPRPVQFFYFYEQGKKLLRIRTENILGNDAYSKEVLNGQMIRFKLPVGKTTYNLRFTLRGAVGAARTAVNYCKEEAAFGNSGSGPAQQPAQGRPAPAPAPNKPDPADDDSKYFK